MAANIDPQGQEHKRPRLAQVPYSGTEAVQKILQNFSSIQASMARFGSTLLHMEENASKMSHEFMALATNMKKARSSLLGGGGRNSFYTNFGKKTSGKSSSGSSSFTPLSDEEYMAQQLRRAMIRKAANEAVEEKDNKDKGGTFYERQLKEYEEYVRNKEKLREKLTEEGVLKEKNGEGFSYDKQLKDFEQYARDKKKLEDALIKEGVIKEYESKSPEQRLAEYKNYLQKKEDAKTEVESKKNKEFKDATLADGSKVDTADPYSVLLKKYEIYRAKKVKIAELLDAADEKRKKKEARDKNAEWEGELPDGSAVDTSDFYSVLLARYVDHRRKKRALSRNMDSNEKAERDEKAREDNKAYAGRKDEDGKEIDLTDHYAVLLEKYRDYLTKRKSLYAEMFGSKKTDDQEDQEEKNKYARKIANYKKYLEDRQDAYYESRPEAYEFDQIKRKKALETNEKLKAMSPEERDAYLEQRAKEIEGEKEQRKANKPKSPIYEKMYQEIAARTSAPAPAVSPASVPAPAPSNLPKSGPLADVAAAFQQVLGDVTKKAAFLTIDIETGNKLGADIANDHEDYVKNADVLQLAVELRDELGQIIGKPLSFFFDKRDEDIVLPSADMAFGDDKMDAFKKAYKGSEKSEVASVSSLLKEIFSNLVGDQTKFLFAGSFDTDVLSQTQHDKNRQLSEAMDLENVQKKKIDIADVFMKIFETEKLLSPGGKSETQEKFLTAEGSSNANKQVFTVGTMVQGLAEELKELQEKLGETSSDFDNLHDAQNDVRAQSLLFLLALKKLSALQDLYKEKKSSGESVPPVAPLDKRTSFGKALANIAEAIRKNIKSFLLPLIVGGAALMGSYAEAAGPAKAQASAPDQFAARVEPGKGKGGPLGAQQREIERQKAGQSTQARTEQEIKKATEASTVFMAEVVRVLDGDTIEVKLKDGTLKQVRLANIDAPETAKNFKGKNSPGQPGGEESRQALSEKVLGKMVEVYVKDQADQYGRTVGSVYQEGVDVNLQMVAEGNAVPYNFANASQNMKDAATQAHAEGLGIHSADALPIHPKQWRNSLSEAEKAAHIAKSGTQKKPVIQGTGASEPASAAASESSASKWFGSMLKFVGGIGALFLGLRKRKSTEEESSETAVPTPPTSEKPTPKASEEPTPKASEEPAPKAPETPPASEPVPSSTLSKPEQHYYDKASRLTADWRENPEELSPDHYGTTLNDLFIHDVASTDDVSKMSEEELNKVLKHLQDQSVDIHNRFAQALKDFDESVDDNPIDTQIFSKVLGETLDDIDLVQFEIEKRRKAAKPAEPSPSPPETPTPSSSEKSWNDLTPEEKTEVARKKAEQLFKKRFVEMGPTPESTRPQNVLGTLSTDKGPINVNETKDADLEKIRNRLKEKQENLLASEADLIVKINNGELSKRDTVGADTAWSAAEEDLRKVEAEIKRRAKETSTKVPETPKAPETPEAPKTTPEAKAAEDAAESVDKLADATEELNKHTNKEIKNTKEKNVLDRKEIEVQKKGLEQDKAELSSPEKRKDKFSEEIPITFGEALSQTWNKLVGDTTRNSKQNFQNLGLPKSTSELSETDDNKRRSILNSIFNNPLIKLLTGRAFKKDIIWGKPKDTPVEDSDGTIKNPTHEKEKPKEEAKNPALAMADIARNFGNLKGIKTKDVPEEYRDALKNFGQAANTFRQLEAVQPQVSAEIADLDRSGLVSEAQELQKQMETAIQQTLEQLLQVFEGGNLGNFFSSLAPERSPMATSIDLGGGGKDTTADSEEPPKKPKKKGKKGKSAESKATGGTVGERPEERETEPTYGKDTSGDTVPANLTPGEEVINEEASENNRGLLKFINKEGKNKKISLFASGGTAGGGTTRSTSFGGRFSAGDALSPLKMAFMDFAKNSKLGSIANSILGMGRAASQAMNSLASLTKGGPAFDTLTGSLELLQMSLGIGLTPIVMRISQVIQGFASEIETGTGFFGGLAKTVTSFIDSISDGDLKLLGSLAMVAAGLTTLAPIFTVVIGAVSAFATGISLVVGVLASPVALLIGSVIAAVAYFGGLEGVINLVKGIFNNLAPILTALGAALGMIAAVYIATISPVVLAFAALGAAIGAVIGFFAKFKGSGEEKKATPENLSFAEKVSSDAAGKGQNRKEAVNSALKKTDEDLKAAEDKGKELYKSRNNSAEDKKAYEENTAKVQQLRGQKRGLEEQSKKEADPEYVKNRDASEKAAKSGGGSLLNVKFPAVSQLLGNIPGASVITEAIGNLTGANQPPAPVTPQQKLDASKKDVETKKDNMLMSMKAFKAQPSYSSIDEAYKKIQVSALGTDPIEAKKLELAEKQVQATLQVYQQAQRNHDALVRNMGVNNQKS